MISLKTFETVLFEDHGTPCAIFLNILFIKCSPKEEGPALVCVLVNMFELITKFEGLSDMIAQKDGAGMLPLAGCR